MGKKVGIKEASIITGLSTIELRNGSKSGKYPSYRVGGTRGRIIFDVELLEAHINKLMLKNSNNSSEYESSKIRKIN